MIRTPSETSTMHLPSSIAISGASGFLGSALVPYLRQHGIKVYTLVRKPHLRNDDTIYWNYTTGEIESDRLEGLSAVIHLAGENILTFPWNAEKKRRILESRVRGTSFLSEQLARLDTPPQTFLCASGISFYGDRGAMWVDEDAGIHTSSFLADVCRQWEAACSPALNASIRTVHLRIGIVLDRNSLIMRQLHPVFTLGLGARVANYPIYISWITLSDTLRSIFHLLTRPDVHGPVNIVGPDPVTQHTFATQFAAVLGRPQFLHVPGKILDAFMGELARETLLTSTRVHPGRLLQSGFTFHYPTLPLALTHLYPLG